jgi:hypothetical protein
VAFVGFCDTWVTKHFVWFSEAVADIQSWLGKYEDKTHHLFGIDSIGILRFLIPVFFDFLEISGNSIFIGIH